MGSSPRRHPVLGCPAHNGRTPDVAIQAQRPGPSRDSRPMRSMRNRPRAWASASPAVGQRAMLFHAGALWRLNEVGMLPRLDRVSSVSGGSITAGVLGTRWGDARVRSINGRVPQVRGGRRRAAPAPRREEPRHPAGLEGVLLPGVNAADRYRDALSTHLYGDATLADLPAPGEGPRFIFNATNLASGVLWRFSRPYARDWRVGSIPSPKFSIATAVAASGAFPPFFAPLELDVSPDDFEPGSGSGLQLPGYTERIRLGDGGIYDNLGLETVFKRCRTVLVSDGGGRLTDDPAPPTDWPRQMLRVMKIIDSQVRSLRKRLLIAAYERGDREGAYWGIRSSIDEYGAPGALPCPPDATRILAELPTRLARVPAARQRGLIKVGRIRDRRRRSLGRPGAARPPMSPSDERRARVSGHAADAPDEEPAEMGDTSEGAGAVPRATCCSAGSTRPRARRPCPPCPSMPSPGSPGASVSMRTRSRDSGPGPSPGPRCWARSRAWTPMTSRRPAGPSCSPTMPTRPCGRRSNRCCGHVATRRRPGRPGATVSWPARTVTTAARRPASSSSARASIRARRRIRTSSPTTCCSSGAPSRSPSGSSTSSTSRTPWAGWRSTPPASTPTTRRRSSPQLRTPRPVGPCACSGRATRTTWRRR